MQGAWLKAKGEIYFFEEKFMKRSRTAMTTNKPNPTQPSKFFKKVTRLKARGKDLRCARG